MSINLHQFNQLSDQEAQQLLSSCVHIDDWVQQLIKQRPFNSVQQLMEVAKQSTQSWTWSQVKLALDQHPRIGQKKAHRTLNQKEQLFSEQEQGSLKLDEIVLHQLAEANQQYEDRFGYIFLIRAAGRDSVEILAEIKRRLTHSPLEEQTEVKAQLAQIALLRLQQEVIA